MKEYILTNDEYRMNWVGGNTEWGTVKAPEELEVRKESRREGDVVYETYSFTNISEKALVTSLLDVKIYTPLNDDYAAGADECMVRRCHAHIWCGESISWMYGLRMGGNFGKENMNAGMVLTDGNISGYSIERDPALSSNDRGDIILHPTPMYMEPGETREISWVIFPHSGREDFMKKAAAYCPQFIEITADKYLYFEGEEIKFDLKFALEPENLNINVVYPGGREKNLGHTESDGLYHCSLPADVCGQIRVNIKADGVLTHLTLMVQKPFEELLRARVKFVTERQQFRKKGHALDGAYIIFDNEEDHFLYNRRNDLNAGRERVGMGVLVARFLQKYSSPQAQLSLDRFTDYVLRELFDTETGMVYNDYGKDNSQINRMYNYPWMSVFFCELYRLYKEKTYARYAYLAMKSFYEQGGKKFYAIEIPVKLLLKVLHSARMKSEYDEMLSCFRAQADYIMEIGTSYPQHEVSFEQSIVAPAANVLLGVYEATEDEKYLAAAEKQLEILSLFNGNQPDHHMYEVAIRHWDGFWFGKRQNFGDTFPHYWSALTANAYERYANLTAEPEYKTKAEAAYRAVLSMFFPDGSATCAFVYPATVNGVTTGYADPYANDQDWGMYYYLRHLMDK